MGKPIIDINTNTRAYERAMRIIGNESLPKAVSATLNQTADAVTKAQLQNVDSMTLRTAYTKKSMLSNRAKPYKALNKAMGKRVEKMFSRVGTFSPYLWKQEKGGTFRAKSGGPIPIATDASRISKSSKKSIAKRYRLRPGKLTSGSYGANGFMFIGTPSGRRKGLYLRSKNGKKLTMLRNLDSETVTIKGRGFHSKAVKLKAKADQIVTRFRRNADKEIKKAVGNG